jgi:hypothetical protein
VIPLLFAALALAATPAKDTVPLWSLAFKGESPMAAFFDAASGSLFVSVRSGNGESGHIAKVSQAGKLEKLAFAVAEGAPGALRAFDGKIYWILGNQVQSSGGAGVLSEGSVAQELGILSDIAVDRRGVIYVGTSAGNLVRISAGAVRAEQKGLPITGLFLYQDTLEILRGARLQSVTLSAAGANVDVGSVPFCEKKCRGIERTSTGKWLTVSGPQVIEVNGQGSSRTLYRASSVRSSLGRPAYVYQMNPEDDFFVVPFPAEGVIRAFRVNTAKK